MVDYAEGIYLKQTKGRIGTGITTKDVVYRNFFAIRPKDNGWYELHHLTDKMQPTGLVETCQDDEFKGFVFVAKADRIYAAIRDKLCKAPEPPKPRTLNEVPAEKPADKKAGWKPYVQESSSGSWWDSTSKGSDLIKK